MTGTVSPTLPVIGNPNSSEDANTRSSIITLRDALNAVLTSSNTVDLSVAGGTLSLARVTLGTAGQFIVANNSGVPTYVALSGDGTLSSAGALTLANVALSKLASGTSAQIIVANGSGVPAYVTLSGDATITNAGVVSIGANKIGASQIGSLPAVRATRTTNQSINDSTRTFILFNGAETYDTDTMHDPANSESLTATTAGVYAITTYVRFAVNASGRRLVEIATGGGTTIGAQIGVAVASDPHDVVVTAQYKMAAAESVAVYVTQTSGSPLNVSNATFGMSWLGDG